MELSFLAQCDLTKWTPSNGETKRIDMVEMKNGEKNAPSRHHASLIHQFHLQCFSFHFNSMHQLHMLPFFVPRI